MRPPPSPMRALLRFVLVSPILPAAWLLGQTPIPPATPSTIGSVESSAATISGTLSLADGRALIGSNAVVTAHDRTATVHLTRGGEVLVCSTSVLHAARSDNPEHNPAEPAPLLLALDHGAIEIHMGASARDAILTPDLRLSIVPPGGQGAGAGALDLRLRVASNGDTCVENRGAHAPTLEASEQFGSGLYRIEPGQHLLFEHGSLREVVDNESSPCGCPPPPVLSVASNGISTYATRAARPGGAVANDADGNSAAQASAAQSHPFPAAESQGLTPTQNAAATVPQASPNQPHAQVAATLAFTPTTSFDGTAAAPSDPATAAQPAPGSPAPGQPATAASAAAQPAAASAGSASAGSAAGAPAAAAAPDAGGATRPATPSEPGQPAPAPVPRQSPPPESSLAPRASASPSPTQDAGTVHETAQAPRAPVAPPARTVFRRIGHFFHRLFTGD